MTVCNISNFMILCWSFSLEVNDFEFKYFDIIFTQIGLVWFGERDRSSNSHVVMQPQLNILIFWPFLCYFSCSVYFLGSSGFRVISKHQPNLVESIRAGNVGRASESCQGGTNGVMETFHLFLSLLIKDFLREGRRHTPTCFLPHVTRSRGSPTPTGSKCSRQIIIKGEWKLRNSSLPIDKSLLFNPSILPFGVGKHFIRKNLDTFPQIFH